MYLHVLVWNWNSLLCALHVRDFYDAFCIFTNMQKMSCETKISIFDQYADSNYSPHDLLIIIFN